MPVELRLPHQDDDREPMRRRTLQTLPGAHEIKKLAKNLQVTNKVLIFAPSIRGIRRKDDNLYGLKGRFEPHFYKPSLNVGSMALFV
jgi:hypothetical protein